MKHLNNPHRSALTAIAAVLVLGSTPAIAQQLPSDAGAQTPASASPTVPTAAPEIVIPTSQPNVVPIMPSTTGGLAPITAAPPVAQPAPTISQAPIVDPTPVAEAAPPPQTAQARSVSREEIAQPTEVAATREPATAQATPTTAPVEIAGEPMPGLAPSEMMEMQQSDAAPVATPVEQAAPSVASDGNMWAIVGGTGAVLLLGGAAYALHRRRKVDDRDTLVATSEVRSAPLNPVPTTVVTRDGVVPIATVDTPAVARAQSTQPSVSTTPQFARSASATSLAEGDLEAMAAAAPTADNPFLTRRNRLRRANFLLHRGQTPNAVETAETATMPELAKAYQSQSQRSAQSVYNFGKQPVSFRPAGLKPSTT